MRPLRLPLPQTRSLRFPSRAGFLMCNDLEVAAHEIQSEPLAVGCADPKDKVRDLIQWCVSDEYFALRAHLGLAIA